jgi:ribonuclease HII
MSRPLGKLSIEEIRDRYLRGGEPISPRALNELRRDPRQGARKLYETLRVRYERDRCERVRLDGMLNFERVLWRSGVTRIAGVDEAGTGPLAGPVVAAAVVFAPNTEVAGVDDSKRLEPDDRERLAVEIRRVAVGVGVGIADVGEIDKVNIYHAALLAMRRAVDALPCAPEHVLVDARTIPGVSAPQNSFCKGDGINFSIAAASIIAKTHRDALMAELDRTFPEYGFARHKGYGTAEHQLAIRTHGPCEIHRTSFGAIREICGEFSMPFYEIKHRLECGRSADDVRAVEREIDARRDDLREEEHRRLRLMLLRRWKTI